MYSYIEHTADVGIEVEAQSLEELFHHAADGLIALFVDPSGVRPRDERFVSLTASDLESLLFKWLNEILFRYDSDGFIPCLFQDMTITSRTDEYTIQAKVTGEQFDPTRHETRTYVKAVTFHNLEIKTDRDAFRSQIFVDV